MRKFVVVTAAVLGVVGLAAACTGGAEPEAGSSPAVSAPEVTGSPGAPQGADPAGDPVVLHTEAFGVGVDAAVHPVQVDGDAALVTVDYAFADAAQAEEGSSYVGGRVPVGLLTVGAEKSSWQTGPWGVRLVDVDELTVSTIAVDDDGEPLGTAGIEMSLGQDGPVTAQSVHAAPSGDVIGVMIPFFGLVEVPVVSADGAVTGAGLGTPTELPSFPLRSFEQSYDQVVTTKVEDRSVTLALGSDVLFASSEYALTGQAEQVVADAAEQIQASADGGEVTVIGHTDDVGADDANQTLSQQRADSVTAKLRERLGSGFTVTAEGRGESEPVAAGTSVEARAANRRVELVFEGQQTVETTQTQEGTLPDAEVPVASGTDPVEYEVLNDDVMSASAVSVVRRGGVLVGTLRIEQTGGTPGFSATMLGTSEGGAAMGRGFPLTNRFVGAHEVSLLGATGRTYPLDYLVKDEGSTGSRRLLGDEMMNTGIEALGDAVIATVVWPDTGQDEVTLEANNRFRITDIPVLDETDAG